jgi:hypothetical protein
MRFDASTCMQILLTMNYRRCLVSRKRKLSELYFATVGFAGATEGFLSDPIYLQKEAAFLDANDLIKYVPLLHYSPLP